MDNCFECSENFGQTRMYRVSQSFLSKSICLLHMNQLLKISVEYIKMKEKGLQFFELKRRSGGFRIGLLIRALKVLPILYAL